MAKEPSNDGPAVAAICAATDASTAYEIVCGIRYRSTEAVTDGEDERDKS